MKRFRGIVLSIQKIVPAKRSSFPTGSNLFARFIAVGGVETACSSLSGFAGDFWYSQRCRKSSTTHVARQPRALVHLPQGLKSGDVAIAPRLTRLGLAGHRRRSACSHSVFSDDQYKRFLTRSVLLFRHQNPELFNETRCSLSAGLDHRSNHGQPGTRVAPDCRPHGLPNRQSL